jgi:molecular chaperone DnaK (HSP70)
MAIQRIIGIDFGTSTSIVKVKTYNNGKPLGAEDLADYVRFDGVSDTVPTLVCYDSENDEYMVGHQAKNNSDQGELYANFKLDLISPDDDVRENAFVLVRKFFGHLYEEYNYQRSNFPKCDEEVTYVSYPVKWSRELADEMLRIACDAGFKNVRGIDEASAAIHAVSVLQKDVLKKLYGNTFNTLLIDMGAGTTDLALCRYTVGDKNAHILNTFPKSGDGALFGGKEIDSALWDFVKNYLNECGLTNIINEQRYLPQCKEWKEANVSMLLNKNREIKSCGFIMPILLNLVDEPKPFPTLTRFTFETMLHSYLRQFPELINGIINDTPAFSAAEIDLVILAGGHSQWYFTNEIVSAKMVNYGIVDLPKIRQDCWRVVKLARPHESVALGMVYQPMIKPDAIPLSQAQPQAQAQATAAVQNVYQPPRPAQPSIMSQFEFSSQLAPTPAQTAPPVQAAPIVQPVQHSPTALPVAQPIAQPAPVAQPVQSSITSQFAFSAHLAQPLPQAQPLPVAVPIERVEIERVEVEPTVPEAEKPLVTQSSGGIADEFLKKYGG